MRGGTPQHVGRAVGVDARGGNRECVKMIHSNVGNRSPCASSRSLSRPCAREKVSFVDRCPPADSGDARGAVLLWSGVVLYLIHVVGRAIIRK